MVRWFSVCALLLVAALACAASKPASKELPAAVLSFPDSGTYSYWIQSHSGPVKLSPRTVVGHGNVKLPKWIAPGDTVYILDGHSGGVAIYPIARPGSFSLAVGDFHPVGSPASAVLPAASTAAAPAKPDQPQQENPIVAGIKQIVSWLLGLALAAGVAWCIWTLYKTRFDPLIKFARRLGIDVPDPSVEATEPDRPMPVYTPPVRRPEAIPDDAVLPPPSRPVRIDPGPPISGNGKPQLVAVQGMAAGTVFDLPVGVTQVGRDGENTIVLAESAVSRRHAQFTRDASGIVSLCDLDSANGVYVNGSRVSQATLAPGDEVKIGDNYFRYRA